MIFLLSLLLLPLILGLLTIRKSLSVWRGNPEIKIGKWVLFTLLASLLPAVLMLGSSILQDLTDCSGGNTFEGCETTRESFGAALFMTMWLALMAFRPALIIGGISIVVSVFFWVLGKIRNAEKVDL